MCMAGCYLQKLQRDMTCLMSEICGMSSHEGTPFAFPWAVKATQPDRR